MNDQSLWYLENIDIKAIFCPKKIAEGKLDAMTHKVYKKGTYVYLPDEYSDRLYLIIEGRVKIGNYGDSGKEIIKALLNPGELFGELALVGEEKRRDFALAMEDTTVCVMTVEEMRGMLRGYNALSVFMLKIMGDRIQEMESRLESLVFKDSRTRIIEFLKKLAEKKGQRVGYEMLIRKFITHQEIANLTATSRQTVTTVLNELRSKNLLTFNRRRLLIRDMDKLTLEMTS